jgi:hypothetical protein
MPRPERTLDREAGPVEEFAFQLRQLRREAGNPTYRDLARTAHYSPATLAAAAAGRRLPSLPVVLGYVRACAGDETVWQARWEALQAQPVVETRDAVIHDRVTVPAKRRTLFRIALPVVVLVAASVTAFALSGNGSAPARSAVPVAASAELIGIDHFGDGVIRAWPNTGDFPAWPWAGPVGLNSGWTEPDRVRFADLDGDRRAELVTPGAVGDTTTRVWSNNGRFPAWPWGAATAASATWTGPAHSRFADLDGDGKAELVGLDDGTIQVWPNTGRFPAWPWTTPVRWAGSSMNTGWPDPSRVRFADLNGDAHDELIAIVPDGTVTAAENNHRFPDWPWRTSVEIGRGWDGNPDVIQFADLDGPR